MTTTPSHTDPHPQVELYTDGACLGNPGPGGWAYILRLPSTGKSLEGSGGEKLTTNNRMELTSVIRGLEALKRQSAVKIVADSQYVLNGINQWLPDWKRRGWRKADKKPVLNADLWQELDALLQKHKVTVEWTRGHCGHKENERCDQLASRQAEKHR